MINKRQVANTPTNSNNIDEILAKLKAKTTPNKYIREHNAEYWADIADAKAALQTLVIGLIPERKHGYTDGVSPVDMIGYNKAIDDMHKALQSTIEGKK